MPETEPELASESTSWVKWALVEKTLSNIVTEINGLRVGLGGTMGVSKQGLRS